MELLTIKDVSKKLKMNTTDTYKLIKSGNDAVYFICCTWPSALAIAEYSSAPGTE